MGRKRAPWFWAFMAAGIAVWAPLCAAPPPKMQRLFDEATVRRLVGAVEEDRNDLVLKLGYFAQRRADTGLPATDGLGIVRAAVAEATPRSRRWFLLQSVVGFAGFRVSANTREGAYQAYCELFNRPREALAANAEEVLHRAIYEYAGTLPGGFAKRHFGWEERGQETLEKAMSAYLYLLSQGRPGPYEVPWVRAVQSVADPAGIRALVEKAVADPATPRSYLLLRTAACVYETDPKRVFQLLEQARPMLPKDDPEEAAWYFAYLAQARGSLHGPEGAIAAQQECVRTTGRGQGKLVLLCYEGKDERGLQESLAALAAPDADGAEINEAAAGLLRIHRRDNTAYKSARDAAVQLLTDYLAAKRRRDLTQELVARLILARHYLADRKPDKVKAAATVDHIRPPLPTPHARFLYESLQRVRAEALRIAPNQEEKTE
ncbi:MAG: hypothetical protein HY321_20690 [Armatimonadetes bacterium]|nr:hypothetical protein [Armatimonadota bacterium]